MNKIYLVRHGNIPRIAGDPSITELGVKQAKFTASNLQDKLITKIYCSTSKRAQETTQIIADKLKIKRITLDDRLKERFYWGDDPSQSFEEFIAEWKKTTLDRNYKPHVGDSCRQAGKRLKKFIDELKISSEDKNILLITHGGVIMDLLRNLYDDDYLKLFSPNFLNLGIGECSITQLISHDNTYALEAFDFVTHLPQTLRQRVPIW